MAELLLAHGTETPAHKGPRPPLSRVSAADTPLVGLRTDSHPHVVSHHQGPLVWGRLGSPTFPAWGHFLRLLLVNITPVTSAMP